MEGELLLETDMHVYLWGTLTVPRDVHVYLKKMPHTNNNHPRQSNYQIMKESNLDNAFSDILQRSE